MVSLSSRATTDLQNLDLQNHRDKAVRKDRTSPAAPQPLLPSKSRPVPFHSLGRPSFRSDLHSRLALSDESSSKSKPLPQQKFCGSPVPWLSADPDASPSFPEISIALESAVGGGVRKAFDQ